MNPFVAEKCRTYRKFPFLLGLLIFLSVSCHAQTVEMIVEGAYVEVQNGTIYEGRMLDCYYPPTYRNGKDMGKPVYPGGDVDPKKGICSDLVVRALRFAEIDLQKRVHLDILAHRTAYGVKIPDKYIDHRRVWILKTYFKRNWTSLPTKLSNPEDWRPGDIVIWDIGSASHFHIGIVGKRKRSDGFPFVIHNMGYLPYVFKGKTVEEDVLEGPNFFGIPVARWRVIGHYRFKQK